MKRKTIEIGAEYGAPYVGTYVFQEITWAKRSHIIQKHTKYHPLSGQVLSSDFISIQAETIWASLKQQPASQPVTLEKLLGEEEDGVPIPLGELFSQVANGLCAVTREEQAFLSEPSDAKNPTPPSQTSASAKNSGGPQPNSPSSPPKPCSSSSSSLTK
ncbi:MAG: hypothetical protein NWF00_01550 [Candidatus Bathyarchaeota archaeon]|nr:hypothetical protein [Candidatus Bathyarchaeota archaeon]